MRPNMPFLFFPFLNVLNILVHVKDMVVSKFIG